MPGFRGFPEEIILQFHSLSRLGAYIYSCKYLALEARKL